MVVTTVNEEIVEERQAMMKVYDVNHPLQCGVCDKSGECDLQNYNILTGVSEQSYTIKDTYRPVHDWGFIKYDAGLCIVCEKCTTVCKDMIGDAALKTVPRGGDSLDKSLKESMPKDAYSTWNKVQKSIIGLSSGEDMLDCQDCGECVEVCPVGALVSTDFQYKANAWELNKVPAANPHSSDCAFLYYETKHGDAKNYSDKIFRVTNEHHYAPLSGAARFAFDFENNIAGKDKAMFAKAVEAVKNAGSIKFNSFITNEEALILQRLKEKLGVKLVNDDALRYQKFIKAYQSTSGSSLYSGSIASIKKSNFVITVGTHLRYDAPSVGFAVNNALTMNKGAGLYFHQLGDSIVDGFSKNIMCVANKVGGEEHTLAFILEFLAKAQEADVPAIKYDSKYVNLPEDFDTKIEKMLAKKDKFALVVGEDVFASENVAKIVGLIDRLTDTSVVIIPSQTNTLGVSKICELDEVCEGSVVGYNEDGDFKLSALGDGDLDMPALNQQEGTFTSLNNRVVPTNVALGFLGYNLNDIANALGLEKEYTINYTKELPVEAGYQAVEFDALDNYYDNGGVEHRGYLLSELSTDASDEVGDLKAWDVEGDFVYRSNPINQFNYFTNKASQFKESGGLYVSQEYLDANSLSVGDKVKVDALELDVILDTKLTGVVPYIPTFDKNIDASLVFEKGYRFSQITVGKV